MCCLYQNDFSGLNKEPDCSGLKRVFKTQESQGSRFIVCEFGSDEKGKGIKSYMTFCLVL